MRIQNSPERSGLSPERLRGNSVLICAAATLAVFSVGSDVQAKHSRKETQSPVLVQLFDVYSGLALSHPDVEVRSDDGIVWAKAPCPTNGTTWLGRSDDIDVATIPSSALRFETYVEAKDHRLIKLADDVTKDSSHIYKIDLYPEWLDDAQHGWTRGYKLLDARSGKALANTPVRIEFPANDWPGQHGGISSLRLKTNLLGYVFFSFLRKSEEKPGQTLPSAPPADWMTPEGRVIVSGYREAKLNYFAGPDDERSVVRLQPQRRRERKLQFSGGAVMGVLVRPRKAISRTLSLE